MKNHRDASEQEGESLHNVVNQELRQLYGVRDPCQKLKLVLQRQELWTKADRKLLDAKIRRCPHCQGQGGLSFFYKKGLDKCLRCGTPKPT